MDEAEEKVNEFNRRIKKKTETTKVLTRNHYRKFKIVCLFRGKVAIIGSEDKLQSEAGDSEYKIRKFTWKGKSGLVTNTTR
ncbi:hypothetical protein P5792_24870 [Bacillus toyonensis]|nr:hypothetical protein [Bacillus toyonensis]